jgi:hypothetical protein
MKYIEPQTRRVWSNTQEEYVDTYEVIGYVVRDERGTAIGSGETREEALESAQEAILLPARHLHTVS